MLGKLLNRKKSTDIVGAVDEQARNLSNMQIATYITVPKLDGEPSAKLDRKVTIGHQIGDLILDDDSISNRHCTFYINQGVVSLMDHSSESGTFINKKRIKPGKVFILNDKDKLKIGTIEIKLKELEIPVDIPKSQPVQKPAVENVTEEFVEESFEEVTGEFEVPEDQNQVFEESTGELEIGDDLLTEEVEEVIEDSAENLEPKSALQRADQLSEAEVEEYEEEGDEDSIEETELDESILSPKVFRKHNPFKFWKKQKKPVEDESDLEVDDEEEEDEEIKARKLSAIDAARSRLASGSSGANFKVKNGYTGDPVANMFIRTVACLYDIAFCFILLEVMSVYTDFQIVYKDIPNEIYNFLKPLYLEHGHEYYLELVKNLPPVAPLVDDILSFKYIERVSYFLFFYFLVRVSVAMVFGRTVGQFLIGITNSGNVLVKRIIFPIREIIGFITFPFLIFDVPTIVSRKSLKEFITFSRYEAPSRLRWIFSLIIATPLMLLLFCFAPMYKGLEFKAPIIVTENTRPQKPFEYKNKVMSSHLNMIFDQSEDHVALPDFSFIVYKKKRILNSGLLFFDLAADQNLIISKVKDFEMSKMYQDFARINFVSQYFQPNLFQVGSDMGLKSKDFKFEIKNPIALAEETKQVVKSAFTVDLVNLHEFILENGPLYSGFRDFREKIESIVPTNISHLTFFNVGKVGSLMASSGSGKLQENYFFPLGLIKSSLYKSSQDLASPKYKNVIRPIRYFEKDDSELTESISSQFVTYMKSRTKKSDKVLNQKIYEYYFSVAKKLLEGNKASSVKVLTSNVRRLITALEQKSKKDNKKLYQNMNELYQALIKQDLKFFNIEITKVI